MNTISKRNIIPKTGKNRILLEEYEFGMPGSQLEQIHRAWETGSDLEQIAFVQRRPAMEIVVALLNLADRQKLKRPVAALLRR
ncbi:hypothetical protein [Salimicrobium album]|uniref:Uncharacterized protein n=1 Tax=Salimicrobium album TaxID=50717 RepID=A0A1H3D732_9BACI|nr:hypothetical protein [Salimicrobium album]SDX61948.1 hypothetical protein SAMN04488081_0847 [Salimicrobium album]